jgi:predicted GH43/DUF377 family glycosyl hydrolase
LHYEKKGLIWKPDGEAWWSRSYATIPTPILAGDVIRIYFASLDESKFGRIGFIDVDAANPSRVLYVHPKPVLDLGELGAFDDSGVNASCVLRVDGEYRLYYIGWQRCERVPYMLFTGLAVSDDGRTFRRARRTPVLDRTSDEPFSRSAPFVMRDGETWRMWYWSCERWSADHGVVHYNTIIRHATSDDGVSWSSGTPCLSPQGDEYAVGRPWVVREGSGYRMWFSARSFTKQYVIGCAESPDGLRWTRTGDDVIERSPSGWDSEMVCYPALVKYRDRRYLLYNGNRHGASGFGYAVLSE